jgi:probable HAF family extracellular repeat protein
MVRVSLALAVILLTVAPAVAAPVTPLAYRYFDFGGGGYKSNTVNAINAGGTAIGSSFGNRQGLLYWNNGQRTFVDGSSFRPTSINNLGQVAGTVFTPDGFSAFVRDTDGTVTMIPGAPSIDASAAAINDIGAVVVNTSDGNGSSGAFVWQGSTSTAIVGPGGTAPIATAINNAGVVVGRAGNGAGQTQGFRWQAGSFTSLGSIGNSDSEAYGINEAGDIVGATTTLAGIFSAYVWRSGTMTVLPGLGLSGAAYGINAAGWVVGSGMDDPFTTKAMLWVDGIGYDLGTLVPELASFTNAFGVGINDAGDIIGYGQRAGFETGFILKSRAPGGVPEPASWAMLITGFGLTGAALRRRQAAQEAA